MIPLRGNCAVAIPSLCTATPKSDQEADEAEEEEEEEEWRYEKSRSTVAARSEPIGSSVLII